MLFLPSCRNYRCLLEVVSSQKDKGLTQKADRYTQKGWES